MYLIMILPMAIAMVGFYCVTLGLWELRDGTDRRKYITYMFTGFVLIFIVPILFGMNLGALL